MGPVPFLTRPAVRKLTTLRLPPSQEAALFPEVIILVVTSH